MEAIKRSMVARNLGAEGRWMYSTKVFMSCENTLYDNIGVAVNTLYDRVAAAVMADGCPHIFVQTHRMCTTVHFIKVAPQMDWGLDELYVHPWLKRKNLK